VRFSAAQFVQAAIDQLVVAQDDLARTQAIQTGQQLEVQAAQVYATLAVAAALKEAGTPGSTYAFEFERDA
jgi:hypothetical protein